MQREVQPAVLYIVYRKHHLNILCKNQTVASQNHRFSSYLTVWYTSTNSNVNDFGKDYYDMSIFSKKVILQGEQLIFLKQPGAFFIIGNLTLCALE